MSVTLTSVPTPHSPPPTHPLPFSPPTVVVVYGSIYITNQHFLDIDVFNLKFDVLTKINLLFCLRLFAKMRAYLGKDTGHYVQSMPKSVSIQKLASYLH